MSAFSDVERRCDAVEECYEFMLAYAAQGLPDDRASRSGGQLRELLGRAVAAAEGLPGDFALAIQRLKPEDVPAWEAFASVLARDAAAALAVMRFVLVQPALSSQLVDNLNASLHLRTLLTDIFLVSEALRPAQSKVSPT